MVFYQLLKDPTARNLLRTVAQSPTAQAALGGTLQRNTLSNALAPRDLEQMIEAWRLVLAQSQPYLPRLGKKFARLAAVD